MLRTPHFAKRLPCRHSLSSTFLCSLLSFPSASDRAGSRSLPPPSLAGASSPVFQAPCRPHGKSLPTKPTAERTTPASTSWPRPRRRPLPPRPPQATRKATTTGAVMTTKTTAFFRCGKIQFFFFALPFLSLFFASNCVKCAEKIVPPVGVLSRRPTSCTRSRITGPKTVLIFICKTFFSTFALYSLSCMKSLFFPYSTSFKNAKRDSYQFEACQRCHRGK